jgi:hypothetical protein
MRQIYKLSYLLSSEEFSIFARYEPEMPAKDKATVAKKL